MNERSQFAVLPQLIRDTFRQASASGISWMMLAVTALCAALCLSVNVSGDVPIYAENEPGYFLPPTSQRALSSSVVLVLAGSQPLETATLTATAGRKVWFAFETDPALARREGIETISGHMTLAFGAISIPMSRERSDSVHFLELVLAGGIAGTFGVLLALVWSAGFVPTFLEPQAASVLLAKPSARWQLLIGKYVGVLTFVGFQVILFVGATWLALGLRTGIWDMAYWWCVPLLLLQFAVFYSFSVLLAVLTRSTVACVFGSLLFWLVAWGINYGTVMAHGTMDNQSVSSGTRVLADAAYWISPKPIDAGLILYDALGAKQEEKPEIFKLLAAWKSFSPQLSILSSLVITGAFLALSAHELNAKDY
jgi:ABC-type transport system involved in multi-copper enzyme maturation permease subunit